MAVRLAKAVPMVALGVSTWYVLFKDSEEAMAGFGKDCPGIVSYSWRLGTERVDRFICILVLFFEKTIASHEGQWITGYIMTLFMSVFAFMAVEGSRYRSGWVLSLTPLFALLFQVLGISVVVPAAWLPVYFLYGSGDRSVEQIWTRKISVQRVVAIAFFLLFVQITILGMFFPFERLGTEIAILGFQFSPVLVPFLWLPFRTTEKTMIMRGHKGVIALHLLQAGAGLVWQLTAILYGVREPELPWKVIQILLSYKTHEWVLYFLIVDALVLFLAFSYLSVVEDGILVGLLVTLGAVALGPSFALSAYFVYREQRISEAVVQFNRKKSK